MNEIKLSCDCNAIGGVAYVASPSSGNRVVCCCRDCQSFASMLGKPQSVMDEYGGTDIYQMPMSKLTIYQGSENIACLRLSKKGLYRWYAACCHTPIGNTLGAGAPFIGLVHNFIVSEGNLDCEIGKSRGHIHVDQALATVPRKLVGAMLPTTIRTLAKLAIWKLRGFNKPSPFFSDSGKPIVRPSIGKILV